MELLGIKIAREFAEAINNSQIGVRAIVKEGNWEEKEKIREQDILLKECIEPLHRYSNYLLSRFNEIDALNARSINSLIKRIHGTTEQGTQE